MALLLLHRSVAVLCCLGSMQSVALPTVVASEASRQPAYAQLAFSLLGGEKNRLEAPQWAVFAAYSQPRSAFGQIRLVEDACGPHAPQRRSDLVVMFATIPASSPCTPLQMAQAATAAGAIALLTAPDSREEAIVALALTPVETLALGSTRFQTVVPHLSISGAFASSLVDLLQTSNGSLFTDAVPFSEGGDENTTQDSDSLLPFYAALALAGLVGLAVILVTMFIVSYNNNLRQRQRNARWYGEADISPTEAEFRAWIEAAMEVILASYNITPGTATSKGPGRGYQQAREAAVTRPSPTPSARSSSPGHLSRSDVPCSLGALDCVICLESVPEDESVALPCAHTFHRHCITAWLRNHYTCPLCKFNCILSRPASGAGEAEELQLIYMAAREIVQTGRPLPQERIPALDHGRSVPASTTQALLHLLAEAELDPAVSTAAQDRTDVPSLVTDPSAADLAFTDTHSMADDELLWDHGYDPAL